jgi:hypothetical protein
VPPPKGDSGLESNQGFSVLNIVRKHLGVNPIRATDTPAFRNWFGDSKVVDENGEPLVVYRGFSLTDTPPAVYLLFTVPKNTFP